MAMESITLQCSLWAARRPTAIVDKKWMFYSRLDFNLNSGHNKMAHTKTKHNNLILACIKNVNLTVQITKLKRLTINYMAVIQS